jgi:hypothetical protein
MTRVRGHNGMDQAISARPNIAQGPYYYATLFFCYANLCYHNVGSLTCASELTCLTFSNQKTNVK